MISRTARSTDARSLRAIPIELGYISNRSDLTTEFYIPVLAQAETYDRAAGYFRASLFALVGLAFSDFARRGGKMRLVCSPSLTKDDAEAIERGLDERERLEDSLRNDLRRLL